MTRILSLILLLALTPLAHADKYQIDTKGAHAFIQFRIKHLGYSWLYGRFNTFDGWFSYDEANPDASQVEVNIDTASVDSNHAERDKHLRDARFLHVDEYPQARFVSTAFKDHGDGTATMEGLFRFLGETRPMRIDVRHIGHGKDPWGGYRRGFEGTTRFKLADYGMAFDLGPDSQEVELTLSVEGIRAKP